MKKVLLLFGMVALMSACAGNTKSSGSSKTISIAIVKEVADTMSVDTLGVDSLVIDSIQ